MAATHSSAEDTGAFGSHGLITNDLYAASFRRMIMQRRVNTQKNGHKTSAR